MWLDWKAFQHLRRLENPSVNKNSWHRTLQCCSKENVLSLSRVCVNMQDDVLITEEWIF